MRDSSKACHKEVTMIAPGGGKEAFGRVINVLEGILPIDQINTPVLNSPIGLLTVYHLLTI